MSSAASGPVRDPTGEGGCRSTTRRRYNTGAGLGGGHAGVLDEGRRSRRAGLGGHDGSRGTSRVSRLVRDQGDSDNPALRDHRRVLRQPRAGHRKYMVTAGPYQNTPRPRKKHCMARHLQRLLSPANPLRCPLADREPRLPQGDGDHHIEDGYLRKHGANTAIGMYVVACKSRGYRTGFVGTGEANRLRIDHTRAGACLDSPVKLREHDKGRRDDGYLAGRGGWPRPKPTALPCSPSPGYP